MWLLFAEFHIRNEANLRSIQGTLLLGAPERKADKAEAANPAVLHLPMLHPVLPISELLPLQPSTRGLLQRRALGALNLQDLQEEPEEPPTEHELLHHHDLVAVVPHPLYIWLP